jgi:hypothetical protein
VIWAIPNQGHVRSLGFTGAFTGKVLLEFLRRLRRQPARNGALIYDRHPVHRGAGAQGWLKGHSDRIHAAALPTSSPNTNPGEYLNQDVKSAATEERPPDERELPQHPRAYLRSTQKQPAIVKGFFDHPGVRYAKDTNG